MPKLKSGPVLAIVVLVIAGCQHDENQRIAEMAERTLERQAKQDARNADLQRQVAEGTQKLLESDAASREALIDLQRDLQTQMALIGMQRDQLKRERIQIEAARHREPVIAEAIRSTGLFVACLIPLLIALQILSRSNDAHEDSAMAELLLSDTPFEKSKIARLFASTQNKPSDPGVRRIPYERRDDHDN